MSKAALAFAERARVRRVRLLLDDNFGFSLTSSNSSGSSSISGDRSRDFESGLMPGIAGETGVSGVRKKNRRASAQSAMRAIIALQSDNPIQQQQQQLQQQQSGNDSSADLGEMGPPGVGGSGNALSVAIVAGVGALGFTRSRHGAAISAVARLQALRSRGMGGCSSHSGQAGKRQVKSWEGLAVTLDDVLAEDALDALPLHVPTLLTTTAVSGPEPPIRICVVCQAEAVNRCTACLVRCCGARCLETHQNTRCARWV